MGKVLHNASGGRPRIGRTRSVALPDDLGRALAAWRRRYKLRSEAEALRSMLRWVDQQRQAWPEHCPLP